MKNKYFVLSLLVFISIPSYSQVITADCYDKLGFSTMGKIPENAVGRTWKAKEPKTDHEMSLIVDTNNSKILTFLFDGKVKEAVQKQVKPTTRFKNILFSENLITGHTKWGDKDSDDLYILSLDLNTNLLIKTVVINKKTYTRHYDCEVDSFNKK